MNRRVFLVALALCANAGWARDIRESLWFFADFDSPAQLNGHAFLQDLDGGGFVDGRYGRGYYFHRPATNLLPPMDRFLSDATNFTVKGAGRLSFAKGVLSLSRAGGFRVRPVATGNRPKYLGPTGLTCSFYVRGAKGTVLSMAARLSPVDKASVESATKNRTWGYPDNLVTDRCETVTQALDGSWQRVWCVAIHDNRVSQGRTASLAVRATGPVEMRQFQYELTGSYPGLGFYNPSVWTEGGTSVPATWYTTADRDHLASFPDKEGSFACWTKSSFDETSPNRPAPIWGIHEGWNECWGYQGTFLRVGANAARSLFHCGPRGRTNVWRHVAATWSKDRLAFYVDGKKTGEYPNPTLDSVAGCEAKFHVGSSAAGVGAGDIILDDFAIFKTVLTDEEVAALADTSKGLMDGRVSVIPSIVDFRTFYRNQTNAALRLTLSAAKGLPAVAHVTIGGRSQPARPLRLATGENRVALSFDPAQFRPGTYPYNYTIMAADGTVVASDSGTLEIRGRLERDAWKYMSWGGPKVAHDDFLKTIGFNLVNVSHNDLPRIKHLVSEGYFVNLRHENSADWKKFSFDRKEIAEAARQRLALCEGLHPWTSTLVNSEVYSALTAQDARKCPNFVMATRKAIGMDPNWNFKDSPAQLAFGDAEEKARGLKPFRGVVGPTNAILETLSWFMDCGNPVYDINRTTAQVVHELSPGNVVWTEPIVGQGGIAEGIDGVADWLYCHGSRKILAGQRQQYGMIRGVRPAVKYVPTLSMSAFMGGLDPTKKNGAGLPQKVSMCLSADEMNVYSWIALGATRHDGLSVFWSDAWEYGVSNALRLAVSPDATIDSIAEPDAPARHGAFIKGLYRPVATLLKGLDNVRAPLAILCPSEVAFAAGVGWEPYHYGGMVAAAVMKGHGIPYDWVTDREITADILSRYRYVLFPMAYLLSERHAEAIRAAAHRGTRFVVDRPGRFVQDLAPGTTVLADLHYVHPSKPETVDGPISKWLDSVEHELQKALFARSDRDAVDGGSFTFVKERAGVRYVMVVNDGRSDKPCVLNTFKPDADYRPLAAAQRIATEIAAPSYATICEFGSGRVVRPSFAYDYAPCEARLFIVYPHKPKALDVSLSGPLSAGRVAVLRLVLKNEKGDAMPGRQLVKLTLTGPDGAARDESGLYPMDGGRLSIPLRFAADESPGSLFKKWKAEAEELTTGLKETISFRLK